MKKLAVALASIILSCTGVIAQDISLGARTGISRFLDIKEISSGALYKTWDKELFLRYHTKGRFAFEAGGMRYNVSYNDYPGEFTICWGDVPETHTILIGNNVKAVEINLSAQYDISCGYIREHIPFLNNLHSFIGVNASITHSKTSQINTNQAYSDGKLSNTFNEYSGFSTPFFGMSHTMTYSFNRLYVSSVAAMMVNPFTLDAMTLYSSAFPNSKLSLRIGLGYRLF